MCSGSVYVSLIPQRHDVVVSKDCAYVVSDSGGLKIFDMSSVTSPKLMGGISALDNSHKVSVSGDYAYVASYSNLKAIDISTPTDPQQVASYSRQSENDWALMDVFINDGPYGQIFAYPACYGAGLDALDITTPTSPRLMGTCEVTGQFWCVSGSGYDAYVANYAHWPDTLQRIHASFTSQPSVEASCYAGCL